jgi:FkbM family methyltransferase
MAAVSFGRRLGNKLYKLAFPIYRSLYSSFKAYADRAERQVLRSHLSEGCVVVDAGANIGVYSRFLSECVGPTGLVHSFEPSPDNFLRLRAAVSGFANVRVNQVAVSHTTGEQLFYLSDDLNVDHRAYPTEGESRRTIRVEAAALDDYFKPGERVDLIKLDIQGYELHALRGATRVLAENAQIKLLVEFWPYGLSHAGASAAALLAFLRDQRFTAFIVKADHLQECNQLGIDTNDPTSYVNLFAHRIHN